MTDTIDTATTNEMTHKENTNTNTNTNTNITTNNMIDSLQNDNDYNNNDNDNDNDNNYNHDDDYDDYDDNDNDSIEMKNENNIDSNKNINIDHHIMKEKKDKDSKDKDQNNNNNNNNNNNDHNHQTTTTTEMIHYESEDKTSKHKNKLSKTKNKTSHHNKHIWKEQKEFENALNQCTSISRSKIALATKFALTYPREYKMIVHLVEKSVRKGKTPQSSKLPQLYIIDSICRQATQKVKDQKYIERFGINIEKTFQALCRGPPSDKPYIKKVFSMWHSQKWFPEEKMTLIMKSISELSDLPMKKEEEEGGEGERKKKDKESQSSHKNKKDSDNIKKMAGKEKTKTKDKQKQKLHHKHKHKLKKRKSKSSKNIERSHGKDEIKQSQSTSSKPQSNDNLKNDPYKPEGDNNHKITNDGQDKDENDSDVDGSDLFSSLQAVFEGGQSSTENKRNRENIDIDKDAVSKKSSNNLSEVNSSSIPSMPPMNINNQGNTDLSYLHNVYDGREAIGSPAVKRMKLHHDPNLINRNINTLHMNMHAPLNMGNNHAYPPQPFEFNNNTNNMMDNNNNHNIRPMPLPIYPNNNQYTNPFDQKARPTGGSTGNTNPPNNSNNNNNNNNNNTRIPIMSVFGGNNNGEGSTSQFGERAASVANNTNSTNTDSNNPNIKRRKSRFQDKPSTDIFGFEVSHDQNQCPSDKIRVWSTTLFIGFFREKPIPPVEVVRQECEKHGTVQQIKPFPEKAYIFVQYQNRREAEIAKTELERASRHLGFINKIGWGRPPKVDVDAFDFSSGTGYVSKQVLNEIGDDDNPMPNSNRALGENTTIKPRSPRPMSIPMSMPMAMPMSLSRPMAMSGHLPLPFNSNQMPPFNPPMMNRNPNGNGNNNKNIPLQHPAHMFKSGAGGGMYDPNSMHQMWY